MHLAELLTEVCYTAEHFENITVTDLIYDSRKVKKGCVFVCLKGALADGHDFAQQAVENGAAALIVQQELSFPCNIPVIRVTNTRKALAMMSAAFFGHPAKELSVIGLTGTKGKTTTAYMLRAVLEHAGIKTGLIGTVGALIEETVIATNNTTPESYELQKYLRKMANAGCKAAVVEVSSIGLREHRTAGMTFAVGVFTNFSKDHIGGAEHKDMEEYLQCKKMLFEQSRIGAVNCDDPVWQRMVQGNTCKELVTFGFAQGADYRASDTELLCKPGYLGVRFTLSGRRNMAVEVGMPGEFSVYNALAAVAASTPFAVSEQAIFQGLSTVKVKGRVEPVAVDGGYTLLIDYAHNAASMENLLKTLREYRPKRLICMFGAGGNRSKTRRFEMGEVCGNLADLSVITADNSRFEPVEEIIADIKTGLAKTKGAYKVIPDRKEAIAYCMEQAQPGDMIVLAGKGHEDYQEIAGVKYPFDERLIAEQLNAQMQRKKKRQ